MKHRLNITVETEATGADDRRVDVKIQFDPPLSDGDDSNVLDWAAVKILEAFKGQEVLKQMELGSEE